MISKLHIKNYVLIEELDLDFASGFSVITGETGAGKSILLGALGLLLGERADARALRQNATKCVVEATFDCSDLNLEPLFAEMDVDYDPRECLVRREINNNGKSRAFVNDTPVKLADLKRLAEVLVDIHSQHQNLLIRDDAFLMKVIDNVAENTAEREAYHKSYQAYSEARKELAELEKRIAEETADREYMEFQYQQLAELQLVENEDVDLENEQKRLAHAVDIRQALATAFQALTHDDAPVDGLLRQSRQAVQNVSDFLPDAEEIAQRLESARLELDDIRQTLENETEKLEVDPERLEEINERLSAVYTLEKKHNVLTVNELLKVQEDLEKRLSVIENADESLLDARRKLQAAEAEARASMKVLNATRHQAAQKATPYLLKQLQNLGMPSAQLEFAMEEPTEILSEPLRLKLLFSANKNVKMQDVSQIASGGEIARMMLSIKALTASSGTILFDEIDTGVSGQMARRMGEIMTEMAKHTQIVCITHLPQIAAMGEKHYLVRKTEDENGVATHIRLLDDDERVTQIASLLSGENITQAAMEQAQQLLKA